MKFSPSNKIKIFLSSMCHNSFSNDELIKERTYKYKAIRKAVKDLIEETNLADVWLFEYEGASFESAEDFFMQQIPQSHLVVFIVDNKDEVSDAVQKEINQAKISNKQCMYFFCKEFSLTTTPLQKELSNGSSPKYEEVEKFSEIPIKIYETLIKRLLSIFIKECCPVVSSKRPDEILPEENSVVSMRKPIPVIDNAPINFQNFKKTFDVLHTTFPYNNTNSYPINTSQFDEAISPLLGYIIGQGKIKDVNFNNIIEFLPDLGIDRELVKKRFEIIKLHLYGKEKTLQTKYKKCYKFACEKNAPEWFRFDILIDWKNSLSWKKRDAFREVQENIESNSAQYYPQIDRFSENFEKALLKFLTEDTAGKKYRSVSFFEVDNISKIFIIAAIYGSLTHILLIKNKLKNFYNTYLHIYSDRIFYLGYIRSALISREEIKFIRQNVNCYKGYTGFNSAEANSLWHSAFQAGNDINSYIEKANAVDLLGMYFDDDTFKVAAEYLIKSTEKFLSDFPNRDYDLEFLTKMLETIKKIGYRIGNDTICKLIAKVYSVFTQTAIKNPLLNRTLIRLFSHGINFETIKADELLCIWEAVKDVQTVSDNTEKEYFLGLLLVISYQLKNLNDKRYIVIDNLIAERFSEAKNTSFPDDIAGLIIRINDILDNQQGWAFVWENLFDSLKRKLLKCSITEVSEDSIKKITRLSEKLLYGNRTAIPNKVKIFAITYLIILIQRFGVNKALIKDLMSKQDVTFEEKGISIFESTSNSNVVFVYQTLSVIVEATDISKLLEAISFIESDAGNGLINAADFIRTTLFCGDALDVRIKAILITFTANNIKNARTGVQRYYFGMIILEILLNDNADYVSFAKLMLSQLLDNESANENTEDTLKLHVIKGMNNFKNVDDDWKRYILQKLQVDNNWYIRTSAERATIN